MRNNIKHNSSSLTKEESLARGTNKRERMIRLIENLTQFHQKEKFPHLYIYSPPGLGKTHTVNQFLKESELPYFVVSGNTSMFAFGIQLAVINHQNIDNSNIIIYVDDCDEIFKNEQNCNTMKNVLDGEKKFVYEKSLASQWSFLGDIQKEAINYHSEEGKMGFVVPTDNIRFVFTSNFSLPIDDDVQLARKKGGYKSVLMAHRNAIRSRCKVADFDLTTQEHWGWIADVTLNPDFLPEISLSKKSIILEFLWDNWTHLNERSIRSIEKMANLMKYYPDEYLNLWEMDYLKPNYYEY
jgi:hypothetical protein